MRFEFLPTFREQYLATLAAMTRSPVLLVAWAFLVLLALAWPLFIVFLLERLPNVLDMLFSIFFLASMPVLTALSVWVYRRKNRMVQGNHVVTIDGDGLHVTAPLFDTTLRWAAIRKVVETRRFILFYISWQQAQFIPKRIITSDELLALRELSRERVGS